MTFSHRQRNGALCKVNASGIASLQHVCQEPFLCKWTMQLAALRVGQAASQGALLQWALLAAHSRSLQVCATHMA